jgi:predicted DCC family thiol-disulfide oxidoreductase YuxK
VRVAVRADRHGRVRFAPLEGATFRELVPESERNRLPDSLVLREADGTLRVRSAAVVALLRHCGGPWRALATAADLLPGALADRLYDAVARVRRRVFRRPREACPSVPPILRARFDP